MEEVQHQHHSNNVTISNKRPRIEGPMTDENKPDLLRLVEERRWDEAAARVRSHPEEAAGASAAAPPTSAAALVGPAKKADPPSPLAVACRSAGAPCHLIAALLDAAPHKVRVVLDSRGTPLHEAIVNEGIGVDVIDALLKADEALVPSQQPPAEEAAETSSAAPPTTTSATRATLLQDIDGFTPLHLLIRRRFQSHILAAAADDRDDSSASGLMQILERLVSSCPEAVVIPDRGEYEEPPIIYAIKANIYAPLLGSEDDTLARVETHIFEMVAIMLKHYPQAASRVFSGYRGQYTALHSAVFHGRFTTTIGLLLETAESDRHPEASSSSSSEGAAQTKPALLGNTQGEVPLHFCAMRGERPRTVALLARSSPEAVLQRDSSGLTPFHWLWIRYVGNLLALDEGGRGSDTTIQLQLEPPTPGAPQPYQFETNRYNEFTSLEQGDFGSDLMRMDPPVDFLRMRHIPVEVQGDTESLQWAENSVRVLQSIRNRYVERSAPSSTQQQDPPSSLSSTTSLWSRQEVVTSLFWTKVVSLLEASQVAGSNSPRGDSVLVHTAFASPCCVPALCQVAARLFPEELSRRDGAGRLPLHYAAGRPWHAWDWPRNDGLNEQTAARLLERESLRVMRLAITLSPPEAFRVADSDGRLVLHHAIDTFVKASSHVTCSSVSTPVMADMLKVLGELVRIYPESQQRRDGVSMLFPFLQATHRATEEKKRAQHVREELPLSITYNLLRNNPTLLATATQATIDN